MTVVRVEEDLLPWVNHTPRNGPGSCVLPLDGHKLQHLTVVFDKTLKLHKILKWLITYFIPTLFYEKLCTLVLNVAVSSG